MGWDVVARGSNAWDTMGGARISWMGGVRWDSQGSGGIGLGCGLGWDDAHERHEEYSPLTCASFRTNLTCERGEKSEGDAVDEGHGSFPHRERAAD